jgi:hypothetical protein
MISTTCQHIDSEPNYACECSRVVVWADSTPLASADIAADRASVTLQLVLEMMILVIPSLRGTESKITTDVASRPPTLRSAPTLTPATPR